MPSDSQPMPHGSQRRPVELSPKTVELSPKTVVTPIARITAALASCCNQAVFEKVIAPISLELMVTLGTLGIFGGMGVAAAGKGPFALITSFTSFLILLYVNVLLEGRSLFLSLWLWIIFGSCKLLVDLLIIAFAWPVAAGRQKKPEVGRLGESSEEEYSAGSDDQRVSSVVSRLGKRFVMPSLMEVGLTFCTLGIFGGLGVLAAGKGKGHLQLSFTAFAVLFFFNLLTCGVFFPETVVFWMFWVAGKLLADLIAIGV